MRSQLHPVPCTLNPNQGFTLVELMIYVGLTAIIIGLFGAILVTITRVQGQQSASTQVSQDLNFVMTTIKRHIHEALDVTGFSATSMTLMKDPNTAPATTATISYDSVAKAISVSETGPSPSAGKISSDRIHVDSVLFEHLVDTNNASSQVIRVTITASNITTNPQQLVSRTIESTAAPLLQSR